MWLNKISARGNRVNVTTIIIGSVGGATLACLMFVITADVILRYIFARPIAGSFELVEISMILIIFLGLANTYVNKGHIGVDLVVSSFPRKARLANDIITCFIGFAVTALMARQIFLVAVNDLAAGQVTSTLGIPIYPARFMAGLGMAVFSFVYLMDFAGYLIRGTKK